MIQRKFAQTIQMAVTAAIPNAGTLVFPYPTGEAQASLWDGAGHVLVDGAGNVYSSGFTVAFGTSNITLTNVSLGTIVAGKSLRLSLRMFKFLNPDIIYDLNASQSDRIALARAMRQRLVLAASGAPLTWVDDTVENTLATYTLPGMAMGLNGRVEVIATHTCVNSANLKTPRVRFGGATGTVLGSTSLTTSLSVNQFSSWRNRGSYASQVTVSAPGNSSYGVSGGALATAVINSAVDQDIVISSQKAAGAVGEATVLEQYEIVLVPGLT